MSVVENNRNVDFTSASVAKAAMDDLNWFGWRGKFVVRSEAEVRIAVYRILK